MAGINKVILIGHLGKDPAVNYTKDGKTVANFTLATSETWKDATGAKQERTEWHQVTFFGRLGEIAYQYLKKGAKVYLEGSIRYEKYVDKEGQQRMSVKINGNSLQMLDSKAKDEPQGATGAEYGGVTFGDQDIPF